ANRSGRSRHQNRLARLRLTDIEQAEICGQSGRSQDTQGSRHRREACVELSQIPAVRNSVLAPAPIPGGNIARLKSGIFGFDDFADCSSHHHSANLHRIGVGLYARNPSTHVWINRDVQGTKEHLPATRIPDLPFDKLEIRFLGHPLWSRGKNKLTVLNWHRLFASF